MLRLRDSLFAEDENGNQVFLMKGDFISEVSDAGPMLGHAGQGWNVTCRFTPKHKQWTELVTVDAVKLLKALEG